MAKKVEYGLDVVWKAGEGRAFMAYNRLCADQAKAVFAWDAAKVAGKAVDPRPTIRPATELAAIARAL